MTKNYPDGILLNHFEPKLSFFTTALCKIKHMDAYRNGTQTRSTHHFNNFLVCGRRTVFQRDHVVFGG